MTEFWIETNEVEDVVGSLRHVVRCARIVRNDPQAWKWAILALHSALQGACVCHLTTTATPLGAVTKQNAKDWIKYFEDVRGNPDSVAPRTFLLQLPELLKKVRKPNTIGSMSENAGIAISESELQWLLRFHSNVRNQFVHFEPTSWSIEISGIPGIAKLVARIIEDILRSGWAFRHLNPPYDDEMRRSLHDLANMKWPEL